MLTIKPKQKNKSKIAFLKHSLTASSSKLKANLGFTLLFASLVGSLVFTIGIAILNISLKQLTLTSAGRESQQSFYSADAGIECTLFLDRGAGNNDCPGGYFAIASTTASGDLVRRACGVEVDAPVMQECFSNQVEISYGSISSDVNFDNVTSTFDLEINDTNNICFSVSVLKRVRRDDPTNINTVIESRGYNTCNTSGNVFERAIKTYNY